MTGVEHSQDGLSLRYPSGARQLCDGYRRLNPSYVLSTVAAKAPLTSQKQNARQMAGAGLIELGAANQRL